MIPDRLGPAFLWRPRPIFLHGSINRLFGLGQRKIRNVPKNDVRGGERLPTVQEDTTTTTQLPVEINLVKW